MSLSFFQDRTGFASEVFGAGVALFGLSAFFPWIIEFSFGPLKARRNEPTQETEETLEIAEDDETFDPEVADASEVLAAERLFSTNLVLESALVPTEGPLAGCEFRLFVFDETVGRLLPVWEPPGSPRDSEGWEPGKGATGSAYAHREYTVARGKAVADESFGLTEKQQERYKDLAVVAALPVTDDFGGTLGVLTGSSTDPSTQLDTAAGYDAQLELVVLVKRLWIDVLKWGPRPYDE